MLDLTNRSILAIGAHPDDIELGCLGLLMLAKRAGSKVSCIVMSATDYVRRLELQRALRGALGKDMPIRAYRFPDGGIHCTPTAVAHVEDNLEGIDLVLCMTHWDSHQDHRAIEKIALAACRRRPLTLLGYHSMSGTNQFQADLFVELPEDILERKLAAISCHRSQASRSYMQPEFVRFWHHDRAALLMGLERVELYHVYRLVQSAQGAEADVRNLRSTAQGEEQLEHGAFVPEDPTVPDKSPPQGA